MSVSDLSTPLEVAGQHYGLCVEHIEPLGAGKVNDTFLIKSSRGFFVLQKLNDFFRGDPAFGLNWHTLMEAAQNSSLLKQAIPTIFPDIDGNFLSEKQGSFFRLTSYIEGAIPERTAQNAKMAAKLLGCCHQIMNRPAPIHLIPLPHGEFTNQKLSRREDFEKIAKDYHGHPRHSEMLELIEQAAEAAWQLPSYPLFVRIFQTHDLAIHGDPKRDNFLCSNIGGHLALLDWDSLSYGHLLIDLAEMIRSWAINILNDGEIELEIDTAVSIISGYALSGLPLDEEDLELLPPVLRAIALNLCRRYINDAFTERYFKWNQSAYPSLYMQNRIRAKNMLNLSQCILEKEFDVSSRMKKALVM